MTVNALQVAYDFALMATRSGHNIDRWKRLRINTRPRTDMIVESQLTQMLAPDWRTRAPHHPGIDTMMAAFARRMLSKVSFDHTVEAIVRLMALVDWSFFSVDVRQPDSRAVFFDGSSGTVESGPSLVKGHLLTPLSGFGTHRKYDLRTLSRLVALAIAETFVRKTSSPRPCRRGRRRGRHVSKIGSQSEMARPGTLHRSFAGCARGAPRGTARRGRKRPEAVTALARCVPPPPRTAGKKTGSVGLQTRRDLCRDAFALQSQAVTAAETSSKVKKGAIGS